MNHLINIPHTLHATCNILDGNLATAAITHCMVKACHKIASHKIPIGKYGVFWGNYEIATNVEMNNLMVCAKFT